MAIHGSVQFFILKQIVLFLLLFITSKFGDVLMENKIAHELQFTKALADNVIHFLLGSISWLIATSLEKFELSFVIESLICGAFSSAIDVDHFIAARSWRFRDAVHLHGRPPFHNTTLMTAISLCFILLMNFGGHPSCEKFGWMFLVAVISHHLRDSLRRGIWLWSHYSTRAVDFYPYLAISYVFPLGCGMIRNVLYAVTRPIHIVADALA